MYDKLMYDENFGQDCTYGEFVTYFLKKRAIRRGECSSDDSVLSFFLVYNNNARKNFKQVNIYDTYFDT